MTPPLLSRLRRLFDPLRIPIITLAGTVYGVPRGAAWVVALFPALSPVVLGVLLALPATRQFGHGLFVEEGPIEGPTAIAYFVSAVIGLVYLRRLLRRRAPLREVLLVAGISVLCFAVAGEEVSWGQRMFGLEPLEVMTRINSQKENTLHNIRGFQPFNDWLPFAIGAIGLAAIAGHTRPRGDRAGVPSLLLPYAVAVVLLAGYDRLTDEVSIALGFDLIIGRLGEYVEGLIAVAFATGMCLCMRRESRAPLPATAPRRA